MGRSGSYLGGGTLLNFGAYASGQSRPGGKGPSRFSEINVNAHRRRPDELSIVEQAFVRAVAKAEVAGRSAVIPKALKPDIAHFATVLRWVHSDLIRKRFYFRCLRDEKMRRLRQINRSHPAISSRPRL